jgi:hypothetical protein
MRKTVVFLSLTTALLAAAAAYLVLDLRPSRANASSAGPAATAAAGETASPAAPEAADGSSPNEKSQSDASKDMQAWLKEGAASRAELEDPGMRDKIRDDLVDLYSTDTPGGFTRYVGLSDADYNRLMDLLTDQQLEVMKARYDCALQPGCDMLNVLQTLMPEQRRAVEALLGDARMGQLEKFTDNSAVRASVSYLRTTLPESQRITDAQSEKLVEALGDERREVISEIQQRGAMYGAVMSNQGQIVFSSTSESAEQKYDEARAYQRRMNDRAAGILNSQQLSAYRQMQEQWLETMRKRWEKEAAAPARP